MNIMLFGPPGIGKSTLIGHLKVLGQHAIDLEDVYPSRIRFQIPAQVNNAFLGAADLNPKRRYPNAIKVLLAMDQRHYEARRAKRDSQQPLKADQPTHLINDWMKGAHYDHILDVTNANNAISSLLELARTTFKEVHTDDRPAS